MRPAYSSRRAVLLLTFLTIGASVTEAASVDVFPLVRGLRCVYQFTDKSQGWDHGLYSMTQDSGLAEYAVLDTARMNDTTKAWTILERRNLVRKYFRNSPPIDTTYYVNDSVVAVLTEFTTANHELRSSLYAWGFPATVPTFGTAPVFRFSDSIRSMTALKFSNCMRFAYYTNYDTLHFSNDSGLSRRTSSTCDDHDEYGSVYWRSFRLISRIVVLVSENNTLPAQFALLQNYPNPFNPTTTVTYVTSTRSHVRLKVFDLLGREIAILQDGQVEAGTHAVQWDASAFAAGVYFYRLTTPEYIETKKMLLLR